jgi:Ca2+-transporting ATPase
MERPPRGRADLMLDGCHFRALLGHGVLLTAVVLGAFAVALGPLGFEPARAVTVSFLTIGFAQLFHVFNMADPGGSPFNNEVTRNPAVWAAVALCWVLLVGAIYTPGVSVALEAHDPGLWGWSLVAGASLLPLLVVHTARAARRRVAALRGAR